MSSPPPTPPPTSPTRIGGHYPGASSPSPKEAGGNASGFKVDNPMPHILCEGNNAQPLDIIGATGEIYIHIYNFIIITFKFTSNATCFLK